MATASRSSSTASAPFVLAAALAAASMLGLAWSGADGRQNLAGGQAFAIPPAPSSAAPLRAAAAAAAASDAAAAAIARPQTAVAPTAAIAVAAVAVSLGLASRRSATKPSPARRSVRIVVAAANEAVDVDEDDDFAEDEDFEDDDSYDFDEDDEDDFYDEDEDDDGLEAVCRARFLKGNPMKFRRVLWQIRGRSYRDALMLLEFLPWRHCRPVLTAVQSAAANAQNQFNMDKSRLYIKTCQALDGPTSRRMRPSSKSQMKPYKKRTTHLIIKVAEMSDSQLAEMEF